MNFLSQDQLEQLTGYATPRKQIKWLRDNNFLFVVGADGFPKMLEEHVRQVLMQPERNHKQSLQPNFAALDNYPARVYG